MFESFTQGVERLDPSAAILDLGPANSENLMFWIRRGRSVTAFDLQARVQADRSLRVPERRFGGVLCWNALAYLSADDALTLVEGLAGALVPGGMLFAIFDGDGRSEPTPVSYRILDATRLEYDAVAATASPRAISNSEIERLLRPLARTRTTVLRHGSREALGHSVRQPTEPFGLPSEPPAS